MYKTTISIFLSWAFLFSPSLYAEWAVRDRPESHMYSATARAEDAPGYLFLGNSEGRHYINIYFESNVLGTDYKSWIYRNVSLRWDDGEEEETAWIGAWTQEDDYQDSILVSNQGYLNPGLRDLFLDRLAQHSRLEVSIPGTESSDGVSATFVLDGAPPLEEITKYSREPSEHGFYFPDFVVGGGWSVQVSINNTDSVSPANVLVTTYDQEALPFPGLFSGDNPLAVSRISIPPLGVATLTSQDVWEEAARRLSENRIFQKVLFVNY